jgi:hypothetical protein
MSTPETLLRTVEDARRILGEYIEPGQRKACSPSSIGMTSCTLSIG